MFRLGILSDVHADVHAVSDALRELDRIGCEMIVCCGDVVDYGLFPDEALAELAARKIPTVRGNHDRWATETRGEHGGGWELSPPSRLFLSSMPPSLRFEWEETRVAIHHASPHGDMDGIYPERIDFDLARAHLERADADVLIVGHTHVAFALDVKGVGLIVNPAALLRAPADAADNPPATGTFGVLELPTRRFSVHRAVDGSEVESIWRRLAS